METNNKLKAVDYSARILMAIIAISLVVMLLTSLLSGFIAILSLAAAVLLLFFSITGFKKIKEMFQ